MKRKLTVIALTLALIVTMMPIYTGVAFAGISSHVSPGDVLTFYNTYASDGNNTGVPINSSGLDSGQVVYGTITSEGKVATETTTTTGAIADIPDGNWNWAVKKNTTSSEGAYTLVLKDFNVTGSAVNHGVIDIAANCAIELRGVSSIANTSGSAIYASSANMYFKGDGTLTATGGESVYDSDGIGSISGSITISSGTITATGGHSNQRSIGIFSYSGEINISGGIVNAQGQDAIGYSMGIIAEFGNIAISNATVSAIGGDVKGSGDSFGIYSQTGITISNSHVDAKSGESSKNCNSYGIYTLSTDGIDISGSSTVNAEGGKGDAASAGINSGGKLTIKSGCEVTATGGAMTTSGCNSYGIYANKGFESSGTVHATGGTSSGGSFGIYSEEIVNISGGAVTATAGNAQQKSCGIYAESSILGYNSTINAKSGQGGNLSSGIYSRGGQVSIWSGCTATGGAVTESSGNSYGIYAGGAVYGEGTIHATGGTSSGSSFGIHSPIRQIGIDGGSGRATASTASSSSQAFSTAPIFTNITTSTGAWNSPEMTWGEASTPPTPSTPPAPSSGGSPAPSSSPEPSITTDSNGDSANDAVGGTAIFDRINKKVVITPADGFEVADVTVNGVSKGKVTELTGLLSSDKVVVTFAKSKTPEQIEAEKQAKISAGVKATRIIYPTAVRQKNGKVKLTWQKSYGFKVDYYIIYRSAKKSSGFTKVFTSRTMRYITAKNLKAGKNVYFKVIGVRKVGDNLVKTEISRVEAIKIK